MSRIVLQTFGSLALRRPGEDGEPIARNTVGLAVLAYLSQTPDHRANRRHLAQLFWPHADQGRGRRLLRQALYYVTRQIPGPITRRTEDTVRLAVDRCAVDALEFRDRLSRSEYRGAVDLYRGRFLESFPVENRTEFGHWLDARQRQLRRSLRRAYRGLVGSLLERERYPAAGRRAVEYLHRAPGDHDTHIHLIRRFLDEDRPSLAFRLYEEYRLELLEQDREVPDELLELVANGDGQEPKPSSHPISVADPRRYL